MAARVNVSETAWVVDPAAVAVSVIVWVVDVPFAVVAVRPTVSEIA